MPLFLIQIVVAIVLSIASTLIQQALAKRPEQQRKPGVRGEIQVGGDNPLACILGRYATAGQFEYANTWGTPGGLPNSDYVKVVSVSDLPVRGLAGFYVDGARVTFDSTPHAEFGYPVLEYRRGNRDFLWVKFHDGTQTAADPYLLDKFGSDPERPWLSDMIGRGVAYFIATAHVNREFFPQFPEYLAEVDGIPLDDPRPGTPAHDNPAVGIHTVLLGLSYGGAWFYGPQGVGEHHLRDFEAQMDKCDAAVELDGGGSEKRFRFGYELKVDEEPHAVIAEFLEACSGRIAEIGGAYRLLAGEPGEPVASFTDDDIVISEGQTYDPFPGLEETHNAITATYPEPAEAWGMKDAPPRYSSALEESDDGRRLPFAAEFRAVPHALQVQRLMRAMIEEGRRFRRHSFTAPPNWWQYEPLDVVAWQSARNGYDGKQFLITVLEDLPTANQVAGLQEIDPADYQWSSEYQLPYDVTPVVIQRPDAQPMTGWQVLPYTFVDAASNARRPGIEVRFAGQLDDVRAVRVQVRLFGSASVVFDGESPYDPELEAPSVIPQGSFLPATVYEARGIFLPYSGRLTEWSAWLVVTTPDTRLSQAEFDDQVGALLTRVERQITDRLNQMRADLDAVASAVNGQSAALWERGGQLLLSLGARFGENAAAIQQVAIAYAAADAVQASLINGLQTELTDAQAGIVANSDAIDGLDTRITSAEGTIVSQGSALTALQSTLSGVDLNAMARSIGSLGTLVIRQGSLIRAQADAALLVEAAVNDVTAGGHLQFVAVATPNDALSAFELVAKARAGGVAASTGLRATSYANDDGTTRSGLDLFGDQVRIGIPSVAGGDFRSIVEVGLVDGVPTVAIRGDAILDSGVKRKNLADGAAITLIPFQDPSPRDRTFTAWNNGGAGEELSTITPALVGDGSVSIELQCRVRSLSNHLTGVNWIKLFADGVEIKRVNLPTANNYGGTTFFIKVDVDTLPAGTNTIVAKLFLNDSGTGGTSHLIVEDIAWEIIEYHKPAIQAGGAADATRSYRTTLTTPGVANDPSYPSVGLGADALNKRIIFGAGFHHSANTVTGIAIGGVAAEKLKGVAVVNSSQQVQIWRATVPADFGTSANVAVTTSGGGVLDLAIAVWAITTAAEEPAGIVTGNVNPGFTPKVMADLEVQKGGVVLSFCYAKNRDTMALAWSGVDGVTEDVEANIGSDGNHYQAAGYLTTESTLDDDLTLTSSAVGGNNGAFGLIAVSFR